MAEPSLQLTGEFRIVATGQVALQPGDLARADAPTRGSLHERLRRAEVV